MKRIEFLVLALFLVHSSCWAGELVRINISAFTGDEPLLVNSTTNPELFELGPGVDFAELNTINPAAPNKSNFGPATYQPAVTPESPDNTAGFLQLMIAPVAGETLNYSTISYTIEARFPNNPSSLSLQTSNDSFASDLSVIDTTSAVTETVPLGFTSPNLVQIRWEAGDIFGEFGGGAAGFVNNDIVVTDTPPDGAITGFDFAEGAWLNPATDGEGILFDFGESLDMLFMAWFTFTLEPAPPTPTIDIGFDGQRWMTALLSLDGNTATGVLRARQAGAFDSPPTPDEVGVNVGTISIEFLDCDFAVVNYDVNSAGVSGSFEIQPLEQVVNPGGFSCSL